MAYWQVPPGSLARSFNQGCCKSCATFEHPGAVFHVLARGNQGRAVFRDGQDRQRWLETLAAACQKTGWRVRAYVLLGLADWLLTVRGCTMRLESRMVESKAADTKASA